MCDSSAGASESERLPCITRKWTNELLVISLQVQLIIYVSCQDWRRKWLAWDILTLLDNSAKKKMSCISQ